MAIYTTFDDDFAVGQAWSALKDDWDFFLGNHAMY